MIDAMKYIETEKRKYPIVFNLNVMEEIQEQYGSMSAWGDIVGGGDEPKIKDLKAGLMAMMNEGIDIENEEEGTNEPFVTAKQVGRILSEVGIGAVIQAIQSITVESTQTGDEQKNVQSTRMKMMRLISRGYFISVIVCQGSLKRKSAE